MIQRLTVKQIKKLLTQLITKGKFNIDQEERATNPMRHAYYTGYIDALLDLEEDILNVEYLIKEKAEYKENFTCSICTTKYTAELIPGELSSECPACGHKNSIYDA